MNDGVADKVTVDEIRFQVSGTTVQKAVKHYLRDELKLDQEYLNKVLAERIDTIINKYQLDIEKLIKQFVFASLTSKKDYWGKITPMTEKEVHEYLHSAVNKAIAEFVSTNVQMKFSIGDKGA